MNREILFKGKCLHNGKWVEGGYCQKHETTYCLATDAPNPLHHYIACDEMTDWNLPNKIMLYEVDPSTVCQYTGFADEHHKKIFEGDIVGFIDGLSTENGFAEYEQVGLVEWYGSVGAFNVTERLSAESWEVLEDCVVLGNRWDNPELLEGGTGEDD